MSLITCDETIISFNHEHSHEFNPGRVEARQLVSQLKETAKLQINPVNNQLIAASLKTVDNNPAIQRSLPSRTALTRTLNRNKMQGPLEVISSTDRHFDIPDKYLPFCLHDSGKEDSEQFLVLGDIENSTHTFLEKIQLGSYNQKFNILKATSSTTNQTRKKYRELIEKVRIITNSYKTQIL